MNINLVGFQWKLPGTVPSAGLFAHLASAGITQKKFRGYDRLLPTDYRDGYFSGVFLTVKNQSKFTVIDVHSHAVAVGQLAAGKNLVDFNFFAVNPATLTGIYQYYHNSPSVSTFCDFIQSMYEGLRESLVTAEGGDGSGPGGAAKLKAAKKKFPKKMDTSQLIREDALPELLDELARIKFCDVNINVATASEKYFYPDADAVNSQRLRVSFDASAKQDSLRKNVVQFIKKLKSTKGRVVGDDENGVEKAIHLVNNPDVFGTYDYENVVSSGFINYAKPGQSPFMGLIVKEMKEHDGVFGQAPVVEEEGEQ